MSQSVFGLEKMEVKKMDPNVDPQQTEPLTDSSTPDGPPDPPQRMSRQQIFILISAASVNVSSTICLSILGPFFPPEAVKKGASQTMVGLIFGCYAVFHLIGSLVMGKYIVQIGAKLMLVGGLFVSSVCTILFGLLDRAPEGNTFITLCFVIRSVDAVGFAAAITSSISIAAKVFPNNVAAILGSLETFAGLGLILGPPIGGWLYQSFGYEVPFMGLGFSVMALVPFNMYILPSFDTDPSKNSFLRLLTCLKVVLICFMLTSLSSGMAFLDATLSLFAIKKFNLSTGYVGLIMLGQSLPFCVATPLLGVFTDKYPATRRGFLVLGGFCLAVGFCLLGPMPCLHIPSHLWLVVFMLAVIGFALGMTIVPTLPELIACAYEEGFDEGLSTFGMVSGLSLAVFSFGMFCGPMLGGFITDHLSFEWAAAVQGGVTCLAALLLGVYYLCERPRRQRVQENEIRHSDERLNETII